MSDTTEGYRLSFDLIAPDPEEFKRWLTPLDVVRGMEYDFELKFGNKGKSVFPGGKVELFQFIEYGSSIGRAGLEYRFEDQLNPIPELQLGESKSVGHFKFKPSLEGILVFESKLRSIDNKVITFVGEEGGKVTGTNVFGAFHVVDPNKLRILNMLDKLTKLKDSD